MRRFALSAVCVVVFAIALTRSGRASEPAREFLDALREAGFNDIALEYLERMKNSPLAPVELRETAEFERGLTLMAAAEGQRDLAIREKQLDEAQTNLKQFVTDHPNHLKLTAATLQLGNLLVKRAGMKMEMGKKKENQKAQLTADARKLYDEAFQVFNTLEADVKQKLERIPKNLDAKDKTQARLAEQRNQLREDYLFALLLAAAVREEMAETVAKGSKEYVDMLTDAAKRYGEIYEKYRTRIAGLYARQYQGRSTYKLGKVKDAVSFYTELLEQPDAPDAFRVLKTKTYPLILACWMHDSEKKYAEAIKRGDDWIDKARPNEEREPEWLEIRMLVAKAHVLNLQDLEKTNPKDKGIKESRDKARKYAQFVSRFPGELQKNAQQMVADLGGPDRTKDKTQPKTFAEARDAGKEALDAMQTAELLVQQLPARLAAEPDAAVKQEVQKQLEDAKASVGQARKEASDYFTLALSLADSDTASEDLNVVRYFLCFLHYAEKEYFDAALLGEFVARRHPDSSGARQSAKIAMASYVSLYSQNNTPDKQFESSKIVGIADYISSKWPGHPEADDALNTLIPFMINSGNVAKAEEYLSKIPLESPKRGEAELKTGQAMWGVYQRGMEQLRKAEAEPGGTNLAQDAERKKELDALIVRGEKILTDGINRTKQAGNLTQSTVGAVYALIKVFVDTGRPELAIPHLEDEKFGLITLLDRNDAAMQREGFREELYRTALRTYISVLSKTPDTAPIVQKAQGVMEKMKQAYATMPDGQKKLTGTYISLANELQTQLRIADVETKKSLSKGFELFLNKIRDEAQEVNVLNWVANTYRSMGEELRQGTKHTVQSQAYMKEALTSYDRILAMTTIEPALKTHVRLQKAICHRELGEFSKSFPLFEEILKENNTALNVQAEASRTYQLAADANPQKNGAMYTLAMVGDKPDPKTRRNIIWGWGKIAQMTVHKKQFDEQFFEARYNLAACRFRYALTLTDPEKKKKQLDSAENDITSTLKVFPELGGPESKQKSDALIREIQKANGKQPSGLPAVQPAPARPSQPAAGPTAAGQSAQGQPAPPPANKTAANLSATK